MKDYLKAARDAERRKAWNEATYFATMASLSTDVIINATKVTGIDYDKLKQLMDAKTRVEPGDDWAIPEIPKSDIPPAAHGLPTKAFEAAVDGASALDHYARTPEGMNLIAHAVHRMFREGWVRSEAVR